MATKKKDSTPVLEDEEITQETETVTGAEEQAAVPEADAEKDAMKKQMAEMSRLMANMQAQMAQQNELILQLQSGKQAPGRPLTTLEADRKRVKDACREAAKTGKSAWDEMIEILVPHRERGEDPFYWIMVNNRSVQVPANDTRQTMRLAFAEKLVDAMWAAKHADEFQDSIEVKDPIRNPHEHETF